MGGAIDPRWAVVIASLAAWLPACALVNAAGKECADDEFECCSDGEDNDGDGDTDCDDTNCFGVPGCGAQCDDDPPLQDLGEFPVAPITVNTCDADIVDRSDLGSTGVSCDGSQTVAIYKFHNTSNAMRLICMNYEVAGMASFGANACGTVEPGCVSLIDSCRPIALGARDYFIMVPAGPGDECGPLQISVGDQVDNEVCLNGADDNTFEDTDCEDPFCQGRPECTHPLGEPEEFCNGEDDGNVMTFPTGAIDELACRCINDTGCNDLGTGTLPPYVCHTEVSGGVCGPPCDLGDWCIPFGFSCVSGRCE